MILSPPVKQQVPVQSTATKTKIKTKTKVSIAYAISITQCPKDERLIEILDNPAVLAHSIERVQQNSSYSNNYDLIAFVHPFAKNCTQHISKLGWTIDYREEPVRVEEVPYPFNGLMTKNGCCGEREYLKLYAFALTQFDVVVHLDTDVIMVQPIDELFDAILNNHLDDDAIKTMPAAGSRRKNASSSAVDFLFTRDYVQMSKFSDDPQKLAVQGGFFVARPSLDVFENMKSIIRKGDYSRYSGWGRKHYGGFYGAGQIQGFLSYYYGEISPERGVELNPCVYNSLQLWSPTINGKCRDGNPDPPAGCTDCTNIRLSDTKFTHFTTCYKPWQCTLTKRFGPLCSDSHKEWFRLRQSFERSRGISVPPKDDGFLFDRFRGYCTEVKRENYVPMRLADIVPGR